ncbi:MAG: T9SS type A sorting domain-containing protein [Bacteroidota bacterium]
MQKLLFLSGFIFSFLHFSYSQNPLVKEWDKRFGGTYDDYLTSFQQTQDGGYILGGYSASGIGGDKTQASWGGHDYWIVKTDSLGIKQWDKDFGGTDLDYFHWIQQTADGGYILGGYSYSDSSGDKTQNLRGSADYWIVKTDSLGNKQWDKDFGGTYLDYLHSLQQTADGGYILGGSSLSGIGGDKTQAAWGGSDYWIIKIDSIGNKQWDKDFGGNANDRLSCVIQTTDGGYILGGYSQSDSSGDKTQPSWGWYDYWIVKTDSLGNKQWDKDLGGTSPEDQFGYISQTSDGGYLIAGTSYSNISGDKTENNLGQEQTWVIKTDINGIKQWDKTLHTGGHDEAGFAIQTSDGCYAMANTTEAGIGGDKTQPSWGYQDFWIVKFCDTTVTTSITQLPQLPQLPFSILPNPATETIKLKWNKEQKEKQITINDLFGREVLKEVSGTKYQVPSTKGQDFKIDISFLTPGIYFLKAGNEVKKFVKE